MAGWRVLHVAKRFWPFVGGQERYVLDLARAQTRLGHHACILTADRDLVSGAPGRLPRTDRLDDVEVRRVRVVGGPAKQFIAEPPTTLLRAIRWADVVHHHDPRFAFETTLFAAALLHKPVIVHTHGLFFHTDRATGLKRFLIRHYYRHIFASAAAAVVAGSRLDENTVAELTGIGPDRLRYVPHGIDLQHFAPRGSPPEVGRLLIVGRLAEHKGHGLALEALEALAGVGGPWRIAIAGGGPDDLSVSLAQQARALNVSDRVDWLGEVSDDELPGLMERAQLVLFPSRYEGFGLALIEALASGALVLASPIAAHLEILSGHGLEDRIVNFDRAGEVAARIVMEGSRPRPEVDAIRAAGVVRAASFSVDRMAERVDELYRELVDTGRLSRRSGSSHRCV